MKIRSVMSTHVVTVSPETTLRDAAARLVRYGVSGLPVVDDSGHLVGVLSEADILAKEAGSARAGSGQGGASPRDGMLAWLIGEAPRLQLDARTVADAMSSPALTIGPERTAREAAARTRGTLVTVEGGGHSWILRDPETLPAIVAELMSGDLGEACRDSLRAAGVKAVNPSIRQIEAACYRDKARIFALTPASSAMIRAGRHRRPRYRWNFSEPPPQAA